VRVCVRVCVCVCEYMLVRWLQHIRDLKGCTMTVVLGGALATHCNPLQHTATHCNTLQHTATCCNMLQHTATQQRPEVWHDGGGAGLAFAKHCNTLQHTATHCNTLKHIATHCNTLQHTVKQQRPEVLHDGGGAGGTCCAAQRARVEEAFFRSASRCHVCALFVCVYECACVCALCNTMQHTATYCHILPRTAAYCNILQHTATHCNMCPFPICIPISRFAINGYLYACVCTRTRTCTCMRVCIFVCARVCVHIYI